MKKCLAFLLAAIMLCSAAPLAGFTALSRSETNSGSLIPYAQAADETKTTVDNPQLGDVNTDGKLSCADARLTLRASVELEKFTEEQNKLADVDFDGEISSADARLILRASVGLETLQSSNKEEDTDIGQIYTRDFSPEDVVREENGVMDFVRNEILLVAKEDSTFDDVKQLVESVNGTIVGYIEITGDYQIAFENKTEAELNKLIDDFKKSVLLIYQ